MKPLYFLLPLMLLASISACADESADPLAGESATAAVSNSDLSAGESTTSSDSDVHEINGVRLKLASGDAAHFVNHTDKKLTFGKAAQELAMVFNMTPEEVLQLNGWEKVANELVPLEVSFWMNPRLHPDNLGK
ncbi:MAG: hypothetical protein AAFY44_17810 [Pseudomonadota bacterium]